MIRFEQVTKSYGNRQVLSKISLEILPGEFASIIGPSGAGKTTLINALIGADKVDSGKIFVDEMRIDQLKANELQMFRRKVGVVFQDYKLLEAKNVKENVEFAMEVCGYSDYEIGQRSKEVLEMVGLKGHARHWPVQLSGGEKQRLAIARALVHNPKLIVADEPTGNLDPQNALEIIKLLKSLNMMGITILLTTHNKELVNFLKKRVVRMEGGKVVRDGVGGYER